MLPRLLAFVALVAALALPLVAAPENGVLRWGGDAEGGAPFVESDPTDPSVVRGFDVEIAGEIARRLGRRPRFVQVGYAAIDQSVERGDFEIGLSGVEDTPARRASRATTLPYFEFREVLTQRLADRRKASRLDDLRGRRVGTLGGTLAYDILMTRKDELALDVVSYDDDVHPYEDLLQGRLDAVLLDHVIAARSQRRMSGLATLEAAVARGHYVAVLASSDKALRDEVDDALRAMMADGTLERIFREWDCWDDDQRILYERVAKGDVRPPFEIEGAPAPATATTQRPNKARILNYLPSLFRAALITIVLSCLAMALAVAFGVAIASGRIYGGAVTRALLTLYVEVMRGTPLLLQLFVIYYGLSAVVKLPAFIAALLGLGMNYAAFESEIYRGALEAIPRGQLEAARTLGLTEGQVFRLVRAPQALRLALAPMTNDFVALLKDSSLVSVITVVELTKQTSILASNVGSWLVPGLLCAAIYLAMSLPLSSLARKLEDRWRVRA
ncbi:MAG: ABC transporter permease subunit [Acidobacteria bacterium]|nr:ABC transporter permease subunit [Acidobacteriota bacterium]